MVSRLTNAFVPLNLLPGCRGFELPLQRAQTPALLLRGMVVVALLMEPGGFRFHCSAHFIPFDQSMACVDRPALLLYFSLTRKVYPIGLPHIGIISLEEQWPKSKPLSSHRAGFSTRFSRSS